MPTEQIVTSNDEDEEDCPTMPPPFDFATYAKEAALNDEAESGDPHTRVTPKSGIERVRDMLTTIPDGLDASEPAAARAHTEIVIREMNDRVALGDYAGALDIANKLLATDSNEVRAKVCAETCRMVLKQMYTARIGPLSRVPVVMVPPDEFRWLSIDHRAGFVLSLIDGTSTLEMLLDVSAMTELDTLKILSDLAQQRIISFK